MEILDIVQNRNNSFPAEVFKEEALHHFRLEEYTHVLKSLRNNRDRLLAPLPGEEVDTEELVWVESQIQKFESMVSAE